MGEILLRGGILILLAAGSLLCGGTAARTAAKASAGFARNLRGDIFRKIQGYSFENIDKFSTPSLVTRVTTDVAYVQMAFMQIIRTAIRSPMLLAFATVMAFVTGGTMACVGILIKQLGLPGEVMAIAGLLSLVLDFIATGFSLGLRHLELLLQADRLDMLDHEVLKK
jgi:ATP-binding cassette subfamily B protein